MLGLGILWYLIKEANWCNLKSEASLLRSSSPSRYLERLTSTTRLLLNLNLSVRRWESSVLSSPQAETKKQRLTHLWNHHRDHRWSSRSRTLCSKDPEWVEDSEHLDLAFLEFLIVTWSQMIKVWKVHQRESPCRLIERVRLFLMLMLLLLPELNFWDLVQEGDFQKVNHKLKLSRELMLM